MSFPIDCPEFSAGAMRRANVLCKSLSTVESLGSVNFIGSDKTGTLTQNRMSVANIALGAGHRTFTTEKANEESQRGNEEVLAFAAMAGMCNDAVFEAQATDTPVESRKVNGDATGIFFEIAMLIDFDGRSRHRPSSVC
jgi:sodium/potassium-transporting ATPase subunit alpha